MAKQSCKRVLRRQAKSNMPKAHISYCFIIFLYLSSQNFMRVNSQRQGDWCIANHVTDNGRLQKNIDFACSIIDCGIIFVHVIELFYLFFLFLCELPHKSSMRML
ncbi:unnamed protein product [Brassica oleracea var. botrytis]